MRSSAGVAAAMVLAAALNGVAGRASADTEPAVDSAIVDATAEEVPADDEDDDQDDEAESTPEEKSVWPRLTGAANEARGSMWPAAGDAGHWPSRLLLFSTTDLWRHGAFAHSGAFFAPQWLDREGVVVKLMFGTGTYRYVSGALGNVDVTGRQISAAVLPGFRFIRGALTMAVFAGPEIQHHRLSRSDPSASLNGLYLGLRLGFDLWYQPTDLTLVTADASVSTIGFGYSARLAGGLRLFDQFYFGPEAQAFAGGNYRQYRVGVHVTALQTGLYEWGAGLGWALDNDKRSGAYGKLGVLTRR
jgi:hypothetical protein